MPLRTLSHHTCFQAVASRMAARWVHARICKFTMFHNKTQHIEKQNPDNENQPDPPCFKIIDFLLE